MIHSLPEVIAMLKIFIEVVNWLREIIREVRSRRPKVKVSGTICQQTHRGRVRIELFNQGLRKIQIADLGVIGSIKRKPVKKLVRADIDSLDSGCKWFPLPNISSDIVLDSKIGKYVGCYPIRIIPELQSVPEMFHGSVVKFLKS